MNPQRSSLLAAAFYPTVVIAGWAVVSLAGIGSPRINMSAAAHAADRLAPALAAGIELAAAPPTVSVALPPVAVSYAPTGTTDGATVTEFLAKPVPEKPVPETTPVPDTAAAPETPLPAVVTAMADPAEILPPEVSPAPTASAADAPPQDAAAPAPDVATKANRIEIVGECIVVDACIDDFLWALYQRTPKEDSVKESELRKVTIKRKGKLVTVTRSFTRLVDADFTWKDPKAADRVSMSMMDYVIGGMDRSFKLKLFHALYAAEAAGLQPGITSAFRDDYRQSIASGLKAASNRSYHGGSSRGGYGHGMAADIVSVNGTNRAQRWVSTETLWKWVDANGKPFGIGRPYLGRDPPHVGPIDGLEYVAKRGGTKTAAASADVKKHVRLAAHAKPPAAKRPVVARSSKGRTV